MIRCLVKPCSVRLINVWYSTSLVLSHLHHHQGSKLIRSCTLTRKQFPRQYPITTCTYNTLSSNKETTSDVTSEHEQSKHTETVEECSPKGHTIDDHRHKRMYANHLDYDLDKLLENIRKAQQNIEYPQEAENSKLTSTSPMGIEEIIAYLKEEGAEDVCVIGVPPERGYVKYFVTCVGMGGRHIQRMADSLAAEYKRAKDEGGKRLRATVEGRESEDWVVVNLADTVVHVMTEETRQLYQLEQLWTLSHRYDNQYRTMERVNLESDALK